MEAGFYWATPDESRSLDADDSAFFHIPEPPKRHVIVNHDVWNVFDVFRLSASQWNYGATGKRISLNYQSVIAVATACGVDVDRDFIELLKCVESGAVAATYGQPLAEVLNG